MCGLPRRRRRQLTHMSSHVLAHARIAFANITNTHTHSYHLLYTSSSPLGCCCYIRRRAKWSSPERSLLLQVHRHLLLTYYYYYYYLLLSCVGITNTPLLKTFSHQSVSYQTSTVSQSGFFFAFFNFVSSKHQLNTTKHSTTSLLTFHTVVV